MRVLLAILICLIATASQATGWNTVLSYYAAGGSTPPPSFDATYDFEGTDAIGAGTLASWAVNTGTPDPNFSSSGLSMQGSDVLHLAATEAADLSFQDNTDATKYVTTVARWDDALENNEIATYSIRNSSNQVIGSFGFRSDGSLSHQAAGGTLRVSGAGVWSAATTIYLKLMVTAGTGADATTRMWYSANGTSWTEVSTASNNGTTTGNPHKIRFENTADTENFYNDYVLENPTDIADASF